MIRFCCPTCKKILQATESQAGQKVACPGCGQRLQIPAPPRNKTVLGSILAGNDPAAGQDAAPVAGSGNAEQAAAAPTGPMWFYVQAGERFGPIAGTDLQQRALAGVLDSRSLVWTTGMPNWVAAGTVSALSFGRAARKPGRWGKTLAWSGVGLATAAGALVAIFFGVLGDRQAPAAEAQESSRESRAVVVKTIPQKKEEDKKQESKKEEKKKEESKNEPSKKEEVKKEEKKNEPVRPPVREEKPKKEEKPRELTTREIVARSEKAVALISHPMGFGTGFLVRPGILATNAHVIEPAMADQLRVYFPAAGDTGKTPLRVEAIMYVDYKRDLALLKVQSNLPALPVAGRYEFQRGQDITVIGNPGLGDGAITLETAVSRGVMSTKLRLDNLDFFQMSISVNGGNSGGPVFDSTGEVVGVVVAKAKKQEGMAFCIPVHDLQAAIAKAEAQGPQVIARTMSLQNGRAVGYQLGFLGRNYADGLKASLDVLMDALKNKKDPSEALAEFRKQNAQLLQKHAAIMNELSAALNRLTSDANLPREALAVLNPLHANVTEMKDLLEGKGLEKHTPKTYYEKVKALINQFQAMTKGS
jgi:S1-C subfamily serine protease